MSAPNAGRQSPEPERQSEAQTGKTSNPNQQGGAQSAEQSQEESKSTLSSLSSNPEGPLDKAAEEKTSKNK